MKKILGLMIVGIILVLAATTNPTKDQYISWAKDELKNQSTNGLEDLGIELIGGSILSTISSQKDYLFFSVYEAKLSSSKKIKVLGVYKHFFVLSKGEEI